jgi:hypothetical protein
MLKRGLLLASVLSFSVSPLMASAATVKDMPPPLPQSAKTAAGLVCKPWKLVATADGDLDGDNKPDAALVTTYRDPRSGVTISRLSVALRDANGALKIADDSDSATLATCGSSSPVTTLAIKNRVLLVHQECNAKMRFNFTYKYQLRKEKWLLIGYEASKVDNMAPTASSAIDVNFVTGEVAATLYEDSKVKASERFLEIRAPRINTTGPGITDWAVPRIVVRPLTKTESAIATQAVYNNKYLFIRVQYDPLTKTTPSRVSLVDGSGKVIPPVESAVTPYGYVLASYDLASAQMKKSEVQTQDWQAMPPDELMHVTLEVQADAEDPAVVRTSRKSPGAVLLSRSHEPIALDNINVETDPMPHPFVFKLPTE